MRLCLLNLVVIHVFSTSLAHGLTLSPCSKPKLQDFRNITKVSIMGAEDRKTFKEYADDKGLSEDDVNKKYAATGLLNCDGYKGTAQLTGNSNVITTVSHMFYDKKCNPKPKKQCFFEVVENGKTQRVKVNLDSARSGGCIVDNKNGDWAVLKLSRSLDKSIKPYKTPSHQFALSKGLQVVQASAYSTNFHSKNMRHLTDCSVRDLAVFDGYPVQTDCDSGPGSSGSAQLIEDQERMTMIAIQSDDIGQPDGTSYDIYKNFNLSTPVVGAFKDAIDAAVAETGGEK